MNLSYNKALYIELFTQIARMHEEVDYRKHLNSYPGAKGRRKDYPSVSVGAEYNGYIDTGYTHNYSSSSDFHPSILLSLTTRLGRLNEHSLNYPKCVYYVGHCAENYAASKVLFKMDPQGYNDSFVLSDLRFTKAFRPRTWKSIDWCLNCHTIFD